jgi:hypothetical protein
MALTKDELISSLQNEVRILQHLCTKIEPSMLEYRPTPKQRSTIELLKYLTNMGPELVKGAKAGAFDVESWTKATQAAEARDFAQTVQALAAQSETYASLISPMTDEELGQTINMFGAPMSKGAFLVNLVLSGHAAYRTQIFLYLKACGRDELSTANLWGGSDPAPAATA